MLSDLDTFERFCRANLTAEDGHAVRRFADGIAAGDLSWDGDPTFAEHVQNAVRRPLNVYDDDHVRLWTVGKDARNSPRKIDTAMAAALSWECRHDALVEGAERPREVAVAFV